MSIEWTPTDEVGDVEAIGEPASGAVSGIVNPVGRHVGTSGRGQIVVVPIVDQRVSEHEEGSGCINRTKPDISHQHG